MTRKYLLALWPQNINPAIVISLLSLLVAGFSPFRNFIYVKHDLMLIVLDGPGVAKFAVVNAGNREAAILDIQLASWNFGTSDIAAEWQHFSRIRFGAPSDESRTPSALARLSDKPAANIDPVALKPGEIKILTADFRDEQSRAAEYHLNEQVTGTEVRSTMGVRVESMDSAGRTYFTTFPLYYDYRTTNGSVGHAVTDTNPRHLLVEEDTSPRR